MATKHSPANIEPVAFEAMLEKSVFVVYARLWQYLHRQSRDIRWVTLMVVFLLNELYVQRLPLERGLHKAGHRLEGKGLSSGFWAIGQMASSHDAEATIYLTVAFFTIFFAGSVVRVATGHGAAVIATALWGTLRLFVDVGQLRQLVAASLWNIQITGLYLVCTTNCREYASWPVVFSSFAAQWPGSALGSAILLAVQPQLLETFVGAVLLCTLAVTGDIIRLVDQAHALFSPRLTLDDYAESMPLVSDKQDEQQCADVYEGTCEGSAKNVDISRQSSQGLIKRASITLRNSSLASEVAKFDRVQAEVMEQGVTLKPSEPFQLDVGSKHGSSLSAWAQSRMGPFNPLIRPTISNGSRSSAFPSLSPNGSTGTPKSPRFFNLTNGQAVPAAPSWQHRGLFAWGLLMGFGQGFLGSSAGMSAVVPMVTMRWLDFPIEVQRSTNGMTGVLNARVLVAAMMGVFRWSEWPLYTAAVVAGLSGGILGGHVAPMLDYYRYRHAVASLLLLAGIVLVWKGLYAYLA